MKKKIWATLGIAGLTFAMGVGGLVGANNINSAKATSDGHRWGIIGSFTGNSWSSDVATSTYDEVSDKEVLVCTIPGGTTFKLRADEAWTVSVGSAELMQSRTGGDTYFEDSSGDAKVKIGYSGIYTFTLAPNLYSYDDKSYGITVSYVSTTEYTVSEYGVLDGTVEGTAFATETAYSSTSFTPKNVVRTGYYSEGWYTDSACTTAYTSVTLSADTSLYCKYTSITSAATYAYFSVNGWSDVHAYSYGGQSQFGSWPGTAITEMTNGATYNGIGAIYRIALHSEYNDAHIIFNGTDTASSESVQTLNLLISSSAACYFSGDAAESSGSADHAAAAKVVYDINIARNAVTASGTVKADSLCGIDSNTAADLIGEYNDLTATQKGYVDASKDYTYDYTDTTAGTLVDVSFTAIIAELTLIGSHASSGSLGFNHLNNSNSVIIVVIISTIAVAGLSIYFLNKKKKNAR